MSNITLNIVEPASPTPVDPGTGTVVPDTGLFTQGTSGAEAAIIATVALVVILAIIGAFIYYKKKQDKTPSLFARFKHTKSTTGLAVLALLVSIGTVAGLVKLTTSAIEGDELEAANVDNSSLTVDVSSTELTIELADQPVFAVLPVEVSVEEATQAGYTLTAYADSTDLVSTTDPDNTIPMVAVDEADLSENELATLVSLTDNAYGLALGEEPTTKDEAVYTALSTDSLNPTIIKSMTEYTPTAANDTTTIYYGFYITPDIPYGTYTNDGEVYYNATINTTLVTFDGKGLYFDEEQTQSTNTVEYIAASQDNNETETSSTINQPISGEYKTPSQSLPYRFLGWSTNPESAEPTYTSEDDIAEHLPISPNIPLTLYAVWQKATTITYDNNGGAGEMDKQTIIAGESANLSPNTFTKDGYTFTGWNTVATPTEQTPGKSYTDKELYQAEAESANVTLFAQWKKNILYMQKVSEWGSSLEIGDEVIAVDNRDDKEYYVARLADGNIWMTQNLDHNIVSTQGFYTYENTDIGHGTTPNPSATWTGTATRATSDSTWTSSKTTPKSYDPGKLYWDGELNENWDGTLDNMTTTSSSNSHYHIGNYYNWTAAVAMSNSSSYTSSGTDVNQSICPAGWRLPNNSDNKSYQKLVNTQSLSAGTSGNIQNSPVYFVYGGDWSGSSGAVGRHGSYWSSVVMGSDFAYLLNFDVDGVLIPQSRDNRGGGYSLRCVAR